MNIPMLIATTAESHSHSVLDALPHMAGMAVVMGALATLWGITAITARILQVMLPEPVAVKAPKKAAVSAVAEPTSQKDPHSIPPPILAAISAAVATVCGNQPVRIISIRPNDTSWEQAGRRSVLTSHRIR